MRLPIWRGRVRHVMVTTKSIAVGLTRASGGNDCESCFQPQSRFPKAKIDGEGGPPPNLSMLFEVDYLRAQSYDSKTVGLFEKEKVSFSLQFFWGVFPLTISVVRLILWSAHGENQDLRTGSPLFLGMIPRS